MVYIFNHLAGSRVRETSGKHQGIHRIAFLVEIQENSRKFSKIQENSRKFKKIQQNLLDASLFKSSLFLIRTSNFEVNPLTRGTGLRPRSSGGPAGGLGGGLQKDGGKVDVLWAIQPSLRPSQQAMHQASGLAVP